MRINGRVLNNYWLKPVEDEENSYWLVGDTYGGVVSMDGNKVKSLVLPEGAGTDLEVRIQKGSPIEDRNYSFEVSEIIECPAFNFILKHE